MADELQHTLTESVEEGLFRLNRTWSSLLATGVVGGIDVSIGVYAMLLIKTNNGSDLLGALGFTIGFIALTMAGSELFTENFLMPVTAVATDKASWQQVVRLWFGTASGNLVGGLLMVFIMMNAFPDLGERALESGQHFIDRGFGIEMFLSAILAGIVITLMTWMMLRKPIGAKLVAAIAASFLLNYGELGHVVVASLEIFAGMFSGSPYGFLDWLPLFLLMAVGNMIGGVGFVTVIRLVQLGHRVEAEKGAPTESEMESHGRRAQLLDKDPTSRERQGGDPASAVSGLVDGKDET